jgi:hypothetical protein
MNSGSFFAGPLVDVLSRQVGFSIDITYYFFAAPIKLSLLSISSERTRNLFFTANLSAGIGIPYPLVRFERGRMKTIFDRH